MARDGLGVTHQFRLDAIADADPRHLRLLEVAVDPVAVAVGDRDVGGALMREVADAHQQVRDIAVHRAANLRAFQVYFRLGELLLGRLEGRFGLDRRPGEDLLFLRAGRDARQVLPALGLDLLDLQIGGLLRHDRLVRLDGNREIERVDHVQYVALVDELVVGHPKLDDAARHLRRHAGDLNAHAAVASPRRRDVVVPGHQRHEHRDQQDAERRQSLGPWQQQSLDVAPSRGSDRRDAAGDRLRSAPDFRPDRQDPIDGRLLAARQPIGRGRDGWLAGAATRWSTSRQLFRLLRFEAAVSEASMTSPPRKAA